MFIHFSNLVKLVHYDLEDNTKRSLHIMPKNIPLRNICDWLVLKIGLTTNLCHLSIR